MNKFSNKPILFPAFNQFRMRRLTAQRILLTALLAGTLDIIAASLQFYFRTGKGPEGVLRFVASGLFGKEAFAGDATKWMITGLVIHYLIAAAFTLFFVLLVKNIAALRANRFVTGLLYGFFVWAVMNLLVLPLTKAPPLPRTLSGSMQAMGILILCIGLPLSFLLTPKKPVSQPAMRH